MNGLSGNAVLKHLVEQQRQEDLRKARNLRRSVGNRRHLKPGTGPRIAR
jgi:hypothetical protein